LVIKDPALWEAWESETLLRQPADFRRNLRLLEAMYEEARALGVMSVPQALEGLESRLRLARVLNHRWLREFDRGWAKDRWSGSRRRGKRSPHHPMAHPQASLDKPGL